MELQDTKLWKLFSKKAKKDPVLIDEVFRFCQGAITLSGQIVRFFPNYTLHDGTHITNVCEWMHTLIHNRLFNNLSVSESAFLLMVACSHDLGMIVCDDEKIRLSLQAKENNTIEWKQYYGRHPEDEALVTAEVDRILRNYVRESHHLRAKYYIDDVLPWPNSATLKLGITKENLFNVCKSHNEDLSFIHGSTDDLDLNYCAVLLRLADALDYDSSRAPELLYRFLGLDDPKSNEEKKSDTEWTKNRAGKFARINQNTLAYRSTDVSQPEIFQELTNYIGWINKELPRCISHLGEYSTRWGGNKNLIPALIKINITPVGFKSSDFKLKMDQDKILALLSGEDVYPENGVFVRELLQNSIDAVLTRSIVDDSFSKADGLITIDVWTEGEYYWFRIKDNGIGMDERIIQEYFLNVGCSYYSDKNGLFRDLVQRRITSDFKPISRFGVGFLSCFMGEGNDNTVEVATKRYSWPGELLSKTYRLDVTGLHGLYFLSELSPDKHGRPLHGPEGYYFEEYSHEIGTTVCVRVNILNSGIRSFIEILDKYVEFPEVKIEYHGPEGEKRYHTESELNSLLDSLNPDFVSSHTATVHRHIMPDHVYSSYQRMWPSAAWSNNPPTISLKYWPVHLMSTSNNLSGTIVTWDFEAENVPLALGEDDDTFDAKLVWSFSIDQEGNISSSLYPNEGTEDKIHEIINREQDVPFTLGAIEVSGFHPCAYELTEEEKALLRITGLYGHNIISFEGIRISDGYGLSKKTAMNSSIVLKNDYRPAVSIARDRVRSYPLEAVCDIAIQYLKANATCPDLTCFDFLSAPLSRYAELFKKHPDWGNCLTESFSKYVGKYMYRPKNKALTMLQFAYMKLNGHSIHWTKGYGIRHIIDGYYFFNHKASNSCALYRDEFEFPPTLFVRRRKKIVLNDEYFDWLRGLGINETKLSSDLLGVITAGDISNCYFPDHPFSIWLKTHQKQLSAAHSAVYLRILHNMMEGINPSAVAESINAELDVLRDIPNDPYNAKSISRISERDFIVQSKFLDTLQAVL